MTESRRYFFCGIGGSGMLPLALSVQGLGHEVKGSDRALDQGRTGEKFAFLEARGIELFRQDGSGLTDGTQILVASAAVEDSVPDVQAATRLGCTRMTRAELLASLFNGARESHPDTAQTIAVGGTSGKSTVTGMTGWILHQAGREPTIVNGAVMSNFASAEMPYAAAVAGRPDRFVCEVDESDGSIALFNPTIAVLNNISLDHKSMEELRALFSDFTGKAQTAVINLDNAEAAHIAGATPADRRLTFAIDRAADLTAHDLTPAPAGMSFSVRHAPSGESAKVTLPVPGRHNVSNALAAIGASLACGVTLKAAAHALGTFRGIRRRMEFLGQAGGVTVIDDFAHNPDKIAATLSTLHDFPGRLVVLFQPHGFGPLRLMRQDFVDCFADHLSAEDALVMPEPVYFGGTVERTVTSEDIARDLSQRGRLAEAVPDRESAAERLLERVRPGDRLVIMGARDDTLTEFARNLLDTLRTRAA